MGQKHPGFLRKKSIRTSLLRNFILVAILPTLAISMGSIIFGYFSARQNTVKRLESMAALEEVKINTWIDSGQNELVMTLNETYLLERIKVTLNLEDKDAYYYYYLDGARYRMNRYLGDTRLLKMISVLDLDGNVVLSTDSAQEGKNFRDEAFFSQGLEAAATQIITRPDTGFAIVTACPVTNLEGAVIGELVGEIKPETLTALLSTGEPSGRDGRIFLVDAGYNLLDASPGSLLLAQPPPAALLNVHSQGIDQAQQSKEPVFMSYANHLGETVYGVSRWIPGLDVSLMVEQDLASVLADIVRNQLINLIIIAAGITLAVIISISTSRRIATPLTSLAKASVEIASGDFTRNVQVGREDEIGVLANAFNSMTSQLRALVNGLEARVSDRTIELQQSNQQLLKRAVQMETTSQVSREITSILNIDGLLSRVVNLIQASFAYYHVSIFLLDRADNRLIWRAGSGDLSPDHKAIGLEVISLNSRTARENQAVLVNDVRSEPAFLVDPRLPGTLSELVIPLRMGEQLIGTMDIHHNIVDAFSADDLKVLQGLGDQIAIAIHNALLYEKNQGLAILEERNRMARELHDSISQMLYCLILYADAGSEYFHAGQSAQALDYVDQVKVTAHQALKEMRLMIHELRPSILENEGLSGAIQHRLETVERRSGVEARLEFDPSLKTSAGMEKELYLIAQEALNNVLKHSQARSLTLSLQKEGGDIVFTITDDGVGFAPATVRAGLGLENIRQHAQSLGGALDIQSGPGEGTRLVIRIPGGEHAR